MTHQPTLFDSIRMNMRESIELTIQSLQAHAVNHKHWGIAWSGGKDSTATLTLICYLIDSGKIPAPESLTVFYADTRMELPPLQIAAYQIMDDLQERGIPVHTVMAELDKRFMVYMLGRGVPPPNNNTFRWCTGRIKIEPMQAAVAAMQDKPNPLMITGVRIGESAARDNRIALSCSKDGAECGQGWYQEKLTVPTLAPLLHWRVCHVWEWLKHWAPTAEFGDWAGTTTLADAYGGDEAEEINARTGCIGCPLAQEDKALDAILQNPRWQHLQPLKRLKPIYRHLREPQNRLRKQAERNQNGKLSKNTQRMGPLTLEAREWALDKILEIQADVNTAQQQPFSLINSEEEARIRELIAAKTFPNRWTGDELTADVPIDKLYSDGAVQPVFWSAA